MSEHMRCAQPGCGAQIACVLCGEPVAAPASGEPSGAALRAVIERDRTQVARCIDGLDRVLRGCSWLAEGRGPYEWDDDKYQAEFGRALDALRQGIEPLRAIARDWSDSPTTQAEVDAARASMEPSGAEAVVREAKGAPEELASDGIGGHTDGVDSR